MCPFRGCLGNRLQIWTSSSLCETPFLHKLINTLVFWFWWSTTMLRLLHTALLHKRSGICLKFFVFFFQKNTFWVWHTSESPWKLNLSQQYIVVMKLWYHYATRNHDACCILDCTHLITSTKICILLQSFQEFFLSFFYLPTYIHYF